MYHRHKYYEHKYIFLNMSIFNSNLKDSKGISNLIASHENNQRLKILIAKLFVSAYFVTDRK